MSAALQPEVGEAVEQIDGFWVDEYGEVVGVAEQPELFSINTRDAADWLLGKIAAEEAQIAAVGMRRKALLHNLNLIEKRHQGRINYLRWRFGTQAECFARDELAGGKSRTLRLAHGSLSFRKTLGTTKLADADAAVAWAQEHAPEIVRTKASVTAGDVSKAWDEQRDSDTPDPRWLERSGAGDTFTMKTGIGE